LNVSKNVISLCIDKVLSSIFAYDHHKFINLHWRIKNIENNWFDNFTIQIVEYVLIEKW